MKKAIIVHGWASYPEHYWYQYVKYQLQQRQFKVEIPFMPDVLPLLSRWLKKIREAIGEPDPDTYLIGHSLGSVAVMKYLQTLPAGQTVGGTVLVAGFVDDMGFRPLYNFFTNPLDFKKIKEHCEKFVIIASDNDPYVRPYHAQVLQYQLNAEVIWSHNGHFTEFNKNKCLELPEVVSAIEEFTKGRIKLRRNNYENISVYN